MASQSTPRSFYAAELGTPETPEEKARILVNGPGGADTKQGAKIACLECRSAKIKCSAPTDNQVPCKRCVKHGKECLFEKHKRGRKPNKRFSVPGSAYKVDAGGSQDGDLLPSGDLSLHRSRARSIDGNRESTSSTPKHMGPASSVQSQYVHQTSRDGYFGSESEHRYRSWSNLEGAGRGSEPSAAPWHQPSHPHHGNYHQSQQQQQQHSRSGGKVGEDESQARQSQLPDRQAIYASNGPSRLSYPSGGGSSVPASASTPAGVHHSQAKGGGAPSHGSASSGSAGSQPPQHNGSASRSHQTEVVDYNAVSNRWKEMPVAHETSPRGSGSSGQKALGSMGSPARADGTSSPYGHGRNRSYGQSGPAPSHSYAHWDSQLGSERALRSLRDHARSPNSSGGDGGHRSAEQEAMAVDGRGFGRLQFEADVGSSRSNSDGRHRDVGASSPSSPQHSRHLGVSPSSAPSRGLADGPGRGSAGRTAVERFGIRWRPRSQERHAHPAASGSQPDDADIEYDEEQDELEDDADATREEHDNVLSNPLKLLAQASDAAAARIEGGRLESGGRNSLAAAETMGLLPTGSRSSRITISAANAAVSLTGLGRSIYGRNRAEEPAPPQSWHATRILPPLLHQDRINHAREFGQDRMPSRLAPPFLANLNRSKSYPLSDSLHAADAAANAEETADSRASPERLLAVREAEVGRSNSNSITPSTLDHDAWEYREGKAQARRGYANSIGAVGSPGTMSHGGQTVSSTTSVGLISKPKSRLGDSPHGGGASPTDDLRMVMIGKRKRSRSRLARSVPGHRKRRLNERDTDGELDREESGDEAGTAESRSKDKQVSIAAGPVQMDATGSGSGGEAEAGASRKGYFNLSLFHSKNDDEEGLDPVELGLVELKEVERLFDLFFARINPILDLFDPFLHSVSFVRLRSAFLTTVISSMGARLSDTARDAQIATVLDKHWQNKLLPTILLGGYKSVEISQAFLILTTYSRPTSRLVDDRSWQYLGFAIRTATEVGVNRKVTPSEPLLGNEQVSRRVRNRERLWFNLFLYDRTLSAQTGRPWTISEDRMIVQSSMWHRQDFALPEDVSLVSLIKLRRIAAQHSEAFDSYLSSQDRLDDKQVSGTLGTGEQTHLERRLAGLEFFRKHANADLEKWKESWCINTEEKVKAVDTSTAAGKYLVRWAPTAKLFYYHSRLIINSLVLGTTEQLEDFLSGSSVSVDCWTSAISLIDTVLNDFDDESVVPWSNDRVVMAVYAAVSALRLTNLEQKYPFADKETAIALVRRLSVAMTKAGKTPKHRNGSASPYGRYLKSVLAIFEPNNQASAQAQTPGKDSENALSITTSSLAPGESGSQVVSPSPGAFKFAGDKPPTTLDGDLAGQTLKAIEGEQPLGAARATLSQATGSAVSMTDPGSKDRSANLSNDAPNSMLSMEGSQILDVALDMSRTASASSGGQAVVTPDVKMEDGASLLPGPVGPKGAVPTVQAVSAATAAATTGADAGAGAGAGAGPAVTSETLSGPPRLPTQSLSSLPDGLAMLGPSQLPDDLPLEAWAAPSSTVADPRGSVPSGSASKTSDPAAAAAVDAAAAAATNAGIPALGPAADPSDPAVMTIAAAVASGEAPSTLPFAPGNGSGAVSVDDPESIDRLWDCLTAFEPQGFSSAFWQPPSTWNMNGGGQS